jgi:protein-S-isoprenylcysteine O-methyltransferase Ste14
MTTIAPAVALALLNLIWIAVLARIFFRPGQLNVQWWLNTAPFIWAGVAVVGGVTEVLPGSVADSPLWTSAFATVAALLCMASFGLMGYAVGTHHARPSLWRQSDDAPERLVTGGPYAWIRHPFYTSYILTLFACLLIVPHWFSLAALVWGYKRMNDTAALEEGRFLASSVFGGEYRSYVQRTGRFMPRWRARGVRARPAQPA